MTNIFLDKISKSYPLKDKKESYEILKEISFSVKSQTIVSILGPSGSGKSTLLKILAGFLKESSGEISFNGERVENRIGKVAYMSQEVHVFPWRTLCENIALPLEIQGKNKDLALQEACEILNEVGLGDVKDLYPYESSGGMNQRIHFLRTFVQNNEIVVLDEPFSKIDYVNKVKLMEWVIKLWEKKKKTMIFVTHDIDEALFISDQVIILSDKPTQIEEIIYLDSGRVKDRNQLESEPFQAHKSRLMNRFLSE